jgi:hypothetical protein
MGQIVSLLLYHLITHYNFQNRRVPLLREEPQHHPHPALNERYYHAAGALRQGTGRSQWHQGFVVVA